jgi:PAS domain S-box-containing protein
MQVQHGQDSADEMGRCVEFLLEAVEGSSQPFIIADAMGLIKGCNSAFSRLVGYAKEELISKHVADLTPPEWRRQESGIIAGQVRSRMPAIYRKEYMRKDGSRVPVEVYDRIAFGRDGRPMYFYAFVTDLSEKR